MRPRHPRSVVTPAIAYAAAGLLRDACSLLLKGSRSSLECVRSDHASRARVKIREAMALLGGSL